MVGDMEIKFASTCST